MKDLYLSGIGGRNLRPPIVMSISRIHLNTHFTLLRNAKKVYPRILHQNLWSSPLPGSAKDLRESAKEW